MQLLGVVKDYWGQGMPGLGNVLGTEQTLDKCCYFGYYGMSVGYLEVPWAETAFSSSLPRGQGLTYSRYSVDIPQVDIRYLISEVT